MLKLRSADLREGHSEDNRNVSAQDLDLLQWQEFQAPVDVILLIEKNGDQIVVTAKVQTTASFICDRCIEPFSSALDDTIHLVYTSDIKLKDEEDEAVIYISPTTQEIDLTQPIRETLILALPAKRLCLQDCKGLCARCGANLNHKTCRCPKDHSDPRWDKLKELL